MGKKKDIGKTKIVSKKERRKRKALVLFLCFFLLFGGFLYYYFYIYDGNKLDFLDKTKEEEKDLIIVDENSNKRPIAVMIDNNVGTTSHVGLADAYVTYEAIVEGGLTRIMAIYKDRTTELIGPIRSARHYFLDYALEQDALYAHYGWSTYAEQDIKSLNVDNINGLYVDRAYWRDQSITAPHNVFTSLETLYEDAEKLGYKTTSNNWKNLNYTTEIVRLNELKMQNVSCEEETCDQNPDLIVANNVTIPYSRSEVRSYSYDATRDVYLRFMNGNAHTDKVTKEQYSYKNIIIQKVANESIDSSGRQDLDTTGNGEGYYITGGYALPITWKKASRSSKTDYYYLDGTKVSFNDGNTFVQIEPANMSPTFQ